MNPDVSVIVVNFRTPDLTQRALAAAEAASAGLAIEEIVVENGSGDGSAALIARGRPQARVLEQHDNHGFAAGINVGVEASSGRHLLLLNSDAFMRADSVMRLVRYLDEHPSVGLVAPLLEHDDGTVQNNAYRRFPNHVTLLFDLCFPLGMLTHGRALHPHNLPRRRFDRPRRIAHAMGAVMLVRAEAARAVGPLDERFFLYLEETEWQRRMSAAGWEIHLEPSARAAHLLSASSSGDHSFASPHYIASVDRYFGHSHSARAVIVAAAAVSWATTSLLSCLGREVERNRALARSYRSVIAQLFV